MPNLSNLPAADVQAGATLWNNGFKNYLINGDFAINQRSFAGGALAAGVYGFDRWKAGTGGCNISLSAGVLTHTSGPLVQVIEAPNLAGKTITVSVDELSGGNLTVNVEGVTGAIVAAAGRSGVSIAVPGTSTGNVTVTLTPASGTVTYKRVQVELGSVATGFEWRPEGEEAVLCERYFRVVGGGSGFAISTTQWCIGLTHIQMAAVPAISQTGNLVRVTTTLVDYTQGSASLSVNGSELYGLHLVCGNFSGLTVGYGYALHSAVGPFFYLDAEL